MRRCQLCRGSGRIGYEFIYSRGCPVCCGSGKKLVSTPKHNTAVYIAKDFFTGRYAAFYYGYRHPVPVGIELAETLGGAVRRAKSFGYKIVQ